MIIIGTELLIIGSIIIFLIVQSPKIILTLLLFFLLIGILYYLLTSKKIRDLGHLRQTVTTDIVKKTMNSLYGIKDIKILGKENYFSKLFKNSAYDLSRLSRTISILSQIPKIIIEMALISIVGIIALSLSGNISEIIKVVGLLIFAGLRLMPSISKIIFSIQQLKYNKPAMNVVYDILKISDEKIFNIKDNNNIPKINFDKNIEFQNIKFRYKDGREIFDNINVIFNKGDKIGIFGGSGNGKSTFIDLLSSLIAPTEGTILIDGQELSDINKISWRKKIGYVPQQVYIADDTLRKNIALGVEDKFIDDEKIKSIIKKTNLDNLKSIKNIDEILNIKISNRGLNISGGELQRIALARALYVDTEILILDEATNALDQKNKTELLDNIFELYKNKTIVFITHEEKILKNFNRIFELKNKNLNEK